jgi:hypothetical protein
MGQLIDICLEAAARRLNFVTTPIVQLQSVTSLIAVSFKAELNFLPSLDSPFEGVEALTKGLAHRFTFPQKELSTHLLSPKVFDFSRYRKLISKLNAESHLPATLVLL